VQESNTPRLYGLIFAVILCAGLGGCAEDLDFDKDYGAYPASDSPAPKRTARLKSKAPPPDRALLETPAAPDCGTSQTAKRPAGSASANAAAAELTTQSIPEDASRDANAELAMRIKLEYERECYRQAEARMRDRLKQLQVSVKTVKTTEPANR
jgi:hypothetical protein